ncbi:DUF4189 domain-containing protein [Nocardia jejuensis]|uniref:DUF4189 domain-containing protein n=1 Tax=Nocardia jejuensis TaxID=328049 RepID=UPI0008377FE4|nr:DUF4189 domain-containing protein [Nocardia jejuensis]
MSVIGKVVVAVAAAGFAAGSMIGAGTADAVVTPDGSDLFAAIAFSLDGWNYGTSVDVANPELAINQALDNCAWDGATDCVVLAHWANGCGALVYTDNDTSYGVGTGVGPDRESALRGAYSSLSRYYPPSILANVGSAELSQTHVSEVVCTADV